jgi:ligand-binding sensor domain-containing protein/signal transduction histidine kinase/CheY-like chemotaxis protein/AraC-like DNA-binding protein
MLLVQTTKRLTIPVILTVSGSLRAFSQPPPLGFAHITHEQGLSNSTIESIYQDSRGFIWFGTRDGLNRFDGHGITVFKNDRQDPGSISDDYIRFIYEDKNRRLWIATMNGLNRFDRNRNVFTRFKNNKKDGRSVPANIITGIAEDKTGNLWIATYGGGICRFDEKSGGFIRFYHHPDDPNSLGDDRVNYLYQDRNGNFWVGSEAGLQLFDTRTQRFAFYLQSPVSGMPVNAIQQDRQGNLWLGTEGHGLYVLDPANRKILQHFVHRDEDTHSLGNDMVKTVLVDREKNIWVGGINGGLGLYDPVKRIFYNYQYEPGNISSLSQRTVSALFEDNQGNLWVGTHRGGVNEYMPGKEKFKVYRQELSGSSLSYSDVKSFCEDEDGNIWIGTDGGGLDYFIRNKQTFKHYTHDPFNPYSIGSDAVLDIMRDREGNIWVGTWGGGLNLFNKKTGRFKQFLNDPSDTQSISSNYVQKIFEDYQGNLWVATYYGGLNIYDRRKNTFSRMVYDPSHKTRLYGNNIVSILEDKDADIWIGTDDGGLNCYSQTSRSFTHYFNHEEKIPDLRVIFSDRQGRLWIGQKGLYLFDPQRKSFSLFTAKAGLSDEFIKGITEDEEGNLWISTSNGLTRFNPDTGSFKKYNTGDGLQGSEFEANAYLKTRDGEMYFGGIDGFNCFYPATIKTNSFIPPVYITSFQLFNKKLNPGEKNSLLEKDISLTKEIRLSYKQSTFSLNFAALNYTVPENNQYMYMLENQDKDWIYAGKETKANYTNLDPGEYLFRVKAANNDGLWNDAGTSLRIIITPPFWKTGWFVFILLATVCLSLYLLYKFRTGLKLKQLEEKKKDEMREMQLQFFTNISHEFRTPLSLILGPLEKLIKEDARSHFAHYYELMHRNANRLMGLITELMDFRKLESGSLQLRVMKGNLNGFLEEMYEEFREQAVQKEIQLRLEQTFCMQDVWFDRQVMEKILLNLLNNAIKYTPAGGSIKLEILQSITGVSSTFENALEVKNPVRANSYAYIRIADNGIGISKDSIKHLFERYYRITEAHLGSGIGLAFVKSLVLMHKGDIYVNSERNKGTEIIVAIPVSPQDYTAEEKIESAYREGGVRLESLNNAYAGHPGEATVPFRLHQRQAARLRSPELILLVEDNADLRSFLKDSLSPHYEIAEAADGEEGLRVCRASFPNLIISDVLMPGTGGYAFCKLVKQNAETSHIPFIMLTARSAIESQLEGLDSGADYYFAKPANMEMLLHTIRNIFEQNNKLKERYIRESHVESMELLHSGKDKEFMTRVIQIVEDQLVNPDFDIEWLCRQLGMSRTKVYQKIRSLSGQSIGDFVRGIRLKKAREIMTHEDVSLAEVMYRIGIQTQSYFTKAFKKEFGKTPSQFIQEVRRE